VTNGGGDCAPAVFVRSHAKLRSGALVQPAAGAVSSVIHGSGHVVAGLQIALEQAQAAGVGIFSGRNPQDSFEAPLQVEWALTEDFAKASQGHGLVKMCLDVAADRLHTVGLRIDADRLRLAAQTGAVARFLRMLRTEVERNILASRATRGTRRPA